MNCKRKVIMRILSLNHKALCIKYLSSLKYEILYYQNKNKYIIKKSRITDQKKISYYM